MNPPPATRRRTTLFILYKFPPANVRGHSPLNAARLHHAHGRPSLALAPLVNALVSLSRHYHDTQALARRAPHFPSTAGAAAIAFIRAARGRMKQVYMAARALGAPPAADCAGIKQWYKAARRAGFCA